MGVYTTINDPSAFFQTQTYTGNGSSGLAITNTGNSNLQPDWVWIKQRANTGNNSNGLWDSSRGANKRLLSDTADAEETQTNFTSFNSDGFTVDTGNIVNANSGTYVAWQWKCNGGTTSSNSSGSITSTVQVNTTSGFSIVLYTGNATEDATVGHGFSSAPDVVITKRRSGGTGYWIVSSNDLDAQGTTGGSPDSPRNLYLNDTAAAQSDRIIRQINATTLNLQSAASANSNGDNYVLYCFKEVQGYSKFGHYEGNGNADGAYIYTGFKPAWIMIKRTDSTNNWNIFDNKRDVDNQVGNVLYANLSDEEGADAAHSSANDFLSNGFKLRETGNATNGSGASYVYMAFAQSPFVSSKGVPVTAR